MNEENRAKYKEHKEQKSGFPIYRKLRVAQTLLWWGDAVLAE